MTAHATHRMHANSRASYASLVTQPRTLAILRYLWSQYPIGRTDREVMRGLGLSDPNATRPRISAAIDAVLIEVQCNIKDPETGKTVRCVSLTPAGIRAARAALQQDAPAIVEKP